MKALRVGKPVRLFLAVASLVYAPCASAFVEMNETTLHAFTGKDGADAQSGLVMDGAGNLYGTTYLGGAHNLGVVYRLSPPAPNHATWRMTVLHSFAGGNDGANPIGGVILDSGGNVFGTTEGGGAHGLGTVFEFVPPADGHDHWTARTIHVFAGGTDGAKPYSGLVADKAGNLFGTTTEGGDDPALTHAHIYGAGTVFALSPPAAGLHQWTETIIHKFDTQSGSGRFPIADLAFDAEGNLFGTTYWGGSRDSGTLFEIPVSSGPIAGRGLKKWHDFGIYWQDGARPTMTVAQGPDGTIYGMTREGGEGSVGAFYRFKNGAYRVLPCTSLDSLPTGRLIIDRFSRIIGTGAGSVFKLFPPHGKVSDWSAYSVYGFLGGSDGFQPVGGVIADSAGRLFGVTNSAGAHGFGTIYMLTPKSVH